MASKPVEIEPPEGLHTRGLALWRSLGLVAGTPAGELALEACRTADRLDELDRVIAGKGVLNLMAFRCSFDQELEDGSRELHIKVEFSGVLAEARQQGQAFKELLLKLGMKAAAAPTRAPAAPTSGLDQLAQRRSKKA